MTDRNPWIAFHKPRPWTRLRLFCFPFAGGGASAYRLWQDALPGEIEVCPVQPPGRENRLTQMRYNRAAPLARAAAEAIGPMLDRPFAFFGHSLGAILAYETALVLRETSDKKPVHLIASGRRPPQIPEDDPTYDLPASDFRAKLEKLEGTPVEVLQHPELMDLMIPLLRADFEINDTYEPSSTDPLECPVTAYGGLQDGEVNRETLDKWRAITRGRFRVRMFPGGHFFLNENRRQVVTSITQDLERYLYGREAAGLH